jgi:hypothetical protein
MGDSAGIPIGHQRGGVEGLRYAAAVFWFASLGILACLGAVFLMPFSCWGDPALGSEGACPNGVPAYIENGSLALFAAIIVGAVIIAAIAWAATIGRPNGRAVAMLILGTVAVTPIVLAFVAALALGLVVTLWLGIPAVLLFAAGVDRIRHNLALPRVSTEVSAVHLRL